MYWVLINYAYNVKFLNYTFIHFLVVYFLPTSDIFLIKLYATEKYYIMVSLL